MKDFKFKMYDKVKILSVKGDSNSWVKGVNKVGVVSAVYDPELTPSNYPKCEYRIYSEGHSYYCIEDDLKIVKIVKSYCFKKGEEYHWFSNSKSRKGFIRVTGMDHDFEIL